MKLTLPYPPSANAYWRVWKGRILVSAQARAYKARVGFQAAAAKARGGVSPYLTLAGPVVVSVALYRPQRRGDLDNTLKVLLDALKGIAFVDDSQVVEIHARRFDDKANPRVEVTVEEGT